MRQSGRLRKAEDSCKLGVKDKWYVDIENIGPLYYLVFEVNLQFIRILLSECLFSVQSLYSGHQLSDCLSVCFLSPLHLDTQILSHCSTHSGFSKHPASRIVHI